MNVSSSNRSAVFRPTRPLAMDAYLGFVFDANPCGGPQVRVAVGGA